MKKLVETPLSWTRRGCLAVLGALPFLRPIGAGAVDPKDWPAVVEAARGQTVYFNGWGGAPAINAYIAWVGDRVAEEYGIRLVHVKVTDIAEAVTRLVAERTAGSTGAGSIDLMWINGENFHALKRTGLLFGPFAFDLPNFALVDVEGKPTTLVDFTVPTDGFESPWGMAQLVMLYDSAEIPEPPRTAEALAAWVTAHPGRFTFPAPPDFVGTTFLKQLLLLTTPERGFLQKPVVSDDAPSQTQPLWDWLDAIRPALWRGGQSFPNSHQQLHQMLDDGAVAMSMSFNPGEASQLIGAGRLPETIRTATFAAGSIGNSHFVAIPYNASAAAGAMVVADFLLSPEAQARKANSEVWGDPTVLDMARLEPADLALFEALPLGVATLPPDRLGPVLPEPHPTWMDWLEQTWQQWARS